MAFADEIDRHTGNYEQRMLIAGRKAVLQLASETIVGTPVAAGLARGSWQVGIGQPTLVPGTPDPSGAGAINRALALFSAARPGIWWLTNVLLYIRALEYGHSKQAPQGMLRRAVVRFVRNIEAAAEALRT